MSSNLPAFDLPQSVFMLSLSSNALFSRNESPADLQTDINNFLRGYQPTDPTTAGAPGAFFQAMNQPSPNYPSLAAGDWSAVWGPKVFVETLDGVPINRGATNMMYVAYSPSLKTCVVAIAGTNPSGWSAGTIEDLEVGPANMVAWPTTTTLTPPSVPGQAPVISLNWQPSPQPMPLAANAADTAPPAIDQGTAYGLNVLYTMVCPYTGKTLVEFLSPANFPGGSQSGQTIVFTGHSLGGALSPSLAMLLYPTAANWPSAPPPANAPNPHNGQWQNVYILATAGPTPGNPAFAKLFYQPIPPVTVSAAPAPVPTPVPPARLALAGVKGNYMAVETGAVAASPFNGLWPLMYWNVNYANTNDVVPRAWTNLAMLVQQGPDAYASFFAGGAALSSGDAFDTKLFAGWEVNAVASYMMNKAGYQNQNTTPYYERCLMQYPFNGAWGDWATGQNYPQGFMPALLPTKITLFSDLVPWILNAHLGQYSHAVLGYPCLDIGQMLTPAG